MWCSFPTAGAPMDAAQSVRASQSLSPIMLYQPDFLQALVNSLPSRQGEAKLNAFRTRRLPPGLRIFDGHPTGIRPCCLFRSTYDERTVCTISLAQVSMPRVLFKQRW